MVGITNTKLILINKNFIKDKFLFLDELKELDKEDTNTFSDGLNYLITINNKNSWIWTTDKIEEEKIKELLNIIKDNEIDTINCKKELFSYLNKELETTIINEVEILHCDETIMPEKSIGYLEKATTDTIKDIISKEELEKITDERLYVFKNFQKEIVSITSFKVFDDIAIINYIYNKEEIEYYSSLIYGISNMLLARGITPITYNSDKKNYYEKAGFISDGILTTFKLN